MLKDKMKSLAVGASAAFAAMGAPAAHAQFNIGVAANFGATLDVLISNFQALTGHTLTRVIDSTGNLKACIQTPSTATNFTTNCPGGHYDLFLSADTATPAALSTFGMTTGTVQESPFFYAIGSLDLFSKSVDISAGLPSTFTVPFVIADPSKAPYGFAAMTILNTAPWSLGLNSTQPYPQTTTGQASFVHTEANILATFLAVNQTPPLFSYGLVHKSAICRLNSRGSETYTVAPGFHHEYIFNATDHPYPEIIQNGLAIELGQTSTIKQQVLDFIDYLHGVGSNGTTGLTTIKNFCYGTTAPS
jgi:molybdate transport system substrate-binding protein